MTKFFKALEAAYIAVFALTFISGLGWVLVEVVKTLGK